MGTGRRFYEAVMAYGFRKNSPNPAVYSRKKPEGGKEYIGKVPLHREWTMTFYFDGIDTVSVKKRNSEDYSEMCSLDAFELAYGGGCHA